MDVKSKQRFDLVQTDAAGIRLLGWWPNGQGVLYWEVPGHGGSVATDGVMIQSVPLTFTEIKGRPTVAATGSVPLGSLLVRAEAKSQQPVELVGTLPKLHWVKFINEGKLLAVKGAGRIAWANKQLVLTDLLTGRTEQLPRPKGQVALDPDICALDDRITFVANRTGRVACLTESDLLLPKLFRVSSKKEPYILLQATVSKQEPLCYVLAGFFVSQKVYNSLMHEQRLDLLDFYQKRIRRLYAPLIPLLIAINLWTYFVQPNIYTNVRQSTPSVLLFFNNIYQLLGNRSYFTNHGNFQPFTHMWTLALEVQFYLLYPLLVLLLWRVFKGQWRKTGSTLLGLSVLSATLMAIRYQVGIDPTPIYYSFLCRLFALTTGGAAAFYYLPAAPTQHLQARIPRHIRNLMAVGCLVIIVTAFFFASYQNRFVYQGGMFLYSLVTALCIMLIYPDDLSVARLLSVPCLRSLSQRSYSYYLWQYPLLVLGNSWYAFSTTPMAIRHLQHFGLLLMVGEVSYRFFEQRVITFSNHRYSRLLLTAGILLLVSSPKTIPTGPLDSGSSPW